MYVSFALYIITIWSFLGTNRHLSVEEGKGDAIPR